MKMSLNLSERYAANWGAWEIGREIICNAMDSKAEFSVVPVGDDQLIVECQSQPSLSELFVIGAGTKTEGGDTIGQFGEGFKLAALAATRIGSLTCQVGGDCARFYFDDFMGAKVLHVESYEAETPIDSFVVTIKVPGISKAIEGKFIDGQVSRIVEDQPAGNIYCKGVFIRNIEGYRSAWNLNNLQLNRDRNVPDQSSVKSGLAALIGSNESLIMRFLDDGSAEHECFSYYWHFPKERMKRAIKQKYGENVFLATDLNAAAEVGRRHKRPYYVPSNHIKDALSGLIESDVEILQSEETREKTLVADVIYSDQIKWLHSFDGMAGIPWFQVKVYENDSELLMGEADIEEKIIYLNERLFTAGEESALVATYMHEAAHIISQASDCTEEFQYALTKMIGRLCMQLTKEVK